MNIRQHTADALPTIGKLLAAVIIGISLGMLLPPDPVTLPLFGTVPGLVAGAGGLAIGGVLFAKIPGSSGCGCSGNCGC